MGDTLKINNNGSLLESDGTRGWHVVILDASSDVVGAGVIRYPKYLHVFNHSWGMTLVHIKTSIQLLLRVTNGSNDDTMPLHGVIGRLGRL